MAQLTKIEAIRFSQEDVEFMAELRRLNINPHQVIRLAFREKINREYKEIEKQIEKKNKVILPF